MQVHNNYLSVLSPVPHVLSHERGSITISIITLDIKVVLSQHEYVNSVCNMTVIVIMIKHHHCFALLYTQAMQGRHFISPS